MRIPLLLLVSLGSTLLMTGCGGRGDGGPAPVDAAGDERGGDIVATLGDSITAGSPRWDPDSEVRDSFDEPDRDSQWQRWIADGDDLSFRNCGVWGERTDEIAARFAECASGASAIVIQGGINDIVQGRPVDDAARDIACMAERARRDDLRVALVEVLPWNRGDASHARSIRDLNEQIHELANRGGVPVLPFNEVLSDPNDRDRMPDDRTDDGDHPNVEGYRQLGREAWRSPRTPTNSFATNCEDPTDAA